MDQSKSQAVSEDQRAQSSSRLCDICAKLSFPKSGPVDVKDLYESNAVQLGQIQDIRRKSWCPFCRLVILATFGGPVPYFAGKGRKIELIPTLLGNGYRTLATLKIPGTEIGFLTDTESSDRSGNALRIVGGWEVDIDRVKAWLKLCEKHHSHDCMPSRTSEYSARRLIGSTKIRTIDLLSDCLVEISLDSRYLTLSYVWGDVSSVRLTKRNLAQLSTPGALSKARKDLPRTITDALEFVSMMGERYIWIDTLSLVTDDEEEMQTGIGLMDIIYEGSTLNIIAAAGFDASAGLPGISYGSRSPSQRVEEVRPGVRMAVSREVGQHLSASRYSTRGWTFQEQALPKRSVVFTTDQVYWRCQFADWSEDTNYDDYPHIRREGTFDLIPHALSEETHPIDSYQLLVLYYSRRKLTFESDTLNAMAGLLNRLESRMKSSFLQGLPKATFDLSLLFLLNGNESKDGISHRRPEFPSYSWTGWRNRIIYATFGVDFGTPGRGRLGLFDWLQTKTWIVYYELSPSGTSKLLWNPDVEDAATDTILHIRYPLKRTDRLQRFSRFSNEFSTKPTVSKLSTLPRNYPLLIFWTMAVYLKVSRTSLLSDENSLVYDCNNKFVGPVYTGCDMVDKPVEFLVLSESTEDRRPDSIIWPGAEKIFYRLDSSSKLWDLYWVMAVKNVNGVMERIGLGQIYQNALESSYPPGPIWKECILG